MVRYTVEVTANQEKFGGGNRPCEKMHPRLNLSLKPENQVQLKLEAQKPVSKLKNRVFKNLVLKK